MPESPLRRHFGCFDGLRAIAATLVLLHHSGFQTGASYNNTLLGPYLARGDSGVPIFFLISGFLLYRPYAVAHLTGVEPRSPVEFLRRRFLRIFPAYWLALAGVVLFFGIDLRGWRGLFEYGALVQIYDKHYVIGGITQAWSLATEISFYLFLPVMAAAIRRVRRDPLTAQVAALGGLFVAGQVFRTFAAHTKLADGLAAQYWLPAWFDVFAVGMLLAVVSVAVVEGGRRWSFVDTVGRLPLLWWSVAGVAYWYVSTRVGLPRGLEHIPPGRFLARQALYGVVALFLVLPAVFGPEDRSLPRRILTAGPVAFVGLCSYGIYLWHQAWLANVRHWTGGELFHANLAVVAAGGFVLSVATGALSWFLLEKPVLSYRVRPGRELARHARAAP